jgi:cysteine synthase A
MLVGSSSGAAAYAARGTAEAIASGQLKIAPGNVVTLLADGADRYLSKHLFGSFEEWEH